MGNLGFMFNFENEEKKKVVFIETNKFDGVIILGISWFFRKEICDFYFLNNNFSLNEYLFMDDSKFKYSKIHASEKTICDLDDFVFWFDGRKYREIYRLFLVDDYVDLEKELVSRVNNLIRYFIN